MAVADQLITDKFAIYSGDSMEVMQAMPDRCVGLSITARLSPVPALAVCTSTAAATATCRTATAYERFMEHYSFFVRELARITMFRMSCVHCMDIPRSNSGTDSYIDFPGRHHQMHEANGFAYAGRHMIWKSRF